MAYKLEEEMLPSSLEGRRAARWRGGSQLDSSSPPASHGDSFRHGRNIFRQWASVSTEVMDLSRTESIPPPPQMRQPSQRGPHSLNVDMHAERTPTSVYASSEEAGSRRGHSAPSSTPVEFVPADSTHGSMRVCCCGLAEWSSRRDCTCAYAAARTFGLRTTSQICVAPTQTSCCIGSATDQLLHWPWLAIGANAELDPLVSLNDS